MKPAPPVMRTRSDNWAPPHDSVAGYSGNAAIAWLVWLAGRNPVLSPAPVIASVPKRDKRMLIRFVSAADSVFTRICCEASL